ncbi:MAG: hypothetical protein LBF12_04935 [Christensenellaceae bacterium]|jgi:hypothetical protein|nr:hypothetical protein [Christensenellaceae bacterium]
MSRLRRFSIVVWILISVFFITFQTTSCTRDVPNLSAYIPDFLIDKQPDSTDITVFVNKETSARFTIPVVVSASLSMYNTGPKPSNDRLYLSDISGENIEDLDIYSIQRQCFQTYYESKDTRLFVLTFEFEISTLDDWTSKGIIRKITDLQFTILNEIIPVHVNIKILEKFETVMLFYECPIIRSSDYPTWTRAQYSGHDGMSIFNVGLYFDDAGFGGSGFDEDDDKFITITGFRFYSEVLKLDNIELVILRRQSKNVYDEEIIPLSIENTNHNLTSLQCLLGGMLLKIDVSHTRDDCQVASDNLIMQYTENGDTEKVYEVSLATIHFNDYDALAARVRNEQTNSDS